MANGGGSDGESPPGAGASPPFVASPAQLRANWQFKALRYGGTCVACGGIIERREKGWHDPVHSKVMCTSCRPPEGDLASPSPGHESDTPSNPVGGSSALRVYERQKDRNYRKGATGEYLMDQFLHRTLSDGEVILTDRRLPGTDANIDNVVVASSGVWIIDSKKWSGKIEYKASTLTGIDMHLFVGGEDRTTEIEKIYRLVIPIAQLVDDRSVPICPALVFVEGDWKLSITARHILKKPYKHVGVWISPPRLLAKLIKEPGPLDHDAVTKVGRVLDSHLRPR
jgi:hypothetical protein